MSGNIVTFSTLSNFLIQNKDKKLFYEFIKKKLDLSDGMFELHRQYIDQFMKNHKMRWEKKSKFRKNHFQVQYKNWLQTKFELPQIHSLTIKDKNKKTFVECSVRTKKRRGEKLCEETDHEEIELAYFYNLRQKDKTSADILKKVLLASNETKEQVLKVLNEGIKELVSYTPNESLALLVDAKLTTHQYNFIRSQAKSRNADIYPPYYKVLEAKKECYPAGIQISDMSVIIPLQSILNHTADRLLRGLLLSIFDEEVLAKIEKNGLMMISKSGMDGSSNLNAYKKVIENDSGKAKDTSVFMTALVPLQCSDIVLWTNPNPSSTKWCRPISFHFTKENKETTIAQENELQQQIHQLNSTKIKTPGHQFKVSHKVSLTMIDGKSINYLTDTPTSNCNICDAKPSEMNNLEAVKKKPCNLENYRLGISNLHCWIRFLECLLHIAFKLPILQWRTSEELAKETVDANKERIQTIYKTKKGLLLDFVRPGGSGNTNDGNTARRFFDDPDFAAEVTGLDIELIKRFKVILVTISTRNQIGKSKFKTYAHETAARYVQLYPWYCMPPSVHKVLIHGSEIVDHFDLPIGYYSEEAQEARNKDFKRIRQNNTRKTSRCHINEDIVHGLLISSDPLISSMRNVFEKKHLDFDEEVLKLLVEDSDSDNNL